MSERGWNRKGKWVQRNGKKKGREINEFVGDYSKPDSLYYIVNMYTREGEEKRRDEKRKKWSSSLQTEIIFKDNNYICIIKIQFQPLVILFPTKSAQFWPGPVNNYVCWPGFLIIRWLCGTLHTRESLQGFKILGEGFKKRVEEERN